MSEKPSVILAHPGTQSSFVLAEQLAQRELLSEFWTGFALRKEAYVTKIAKKTLPLFLKNKLSNRLIDGLPAARLRTTPLIEWRALRRLYCGESSQAVFLERNRSFQERIPRKSLQKASTVIGFDTSSWLLSSRSQSLEKPFILKQTTPHPLFKEEMERLALAQFRGWQSTVEARLPELFDCEKIEYRLATKIVVSSSLTKKSLIKFGLDPAKIVIIPYGVDLESFHPATSRVADRAMRFVFVGSISALKGVPLLLDAWKRRQLKDAELWLVGSVSDKVRPLIQQLPNVRILGNFPHDQLPCILRQCDVFVFPSYFEGFGMVLIEALANGLPIITTETTAGPDLIQNGVEGYLIPPGNLEALSEAIRRFVDRSNDIAAMSTAARRRAEQFTWQRHGDLWQEVLQAVCEN